MKNTFSWANPKITEISTIKDKYITHKIKSYQKIKSLKLNELNFENVILELENSNFPYSDDFLKNHLLSQVHPDKNIRDAAQAVELATENELIEIEHDPEVFAVLQNYMEKVFKKEKKNLNEDSIKLSEDYYKKFQRMGFGLTKSNQEKLKNIEKQINELGQKFGVNINNYEDYILCTQEELLGLNNQFISGLNKQGDLYKVSLDYPEVEPFLVNASSRTKRREIAVKNSQKGGKENLNILKKLIDLRIQKAKLLGYKNYTDYKLADKMAKNSEIVNKFVNELVKKIIKPAQKDNKILRTFAKEVGINNMEFYDTAYVTNKLMQDQFNIDQETLRQYFETNHVLDVMLQTFENLLGLKFVRKNTKLWHKDVFHLEMQDKKTGKFLAHLLMDLYPRKSKYSHAAAFNTQDCGEKIMTLVCNFRAPSGSGKNKIPSTMTLREVETIYHEFGHALHFMLYNGKYVSQNSFNVAWDFVELPSQMLENFIWNESSLKKLSKHIKTGQSLSKAEIQNILNSRNFLKPISVARQIAQTRLDLDIHTGKIKSYNKHHQKLISNLVGIVPAKESLFPAGFGHMSGYDSLYYSYLWALVYAEDVFSVFQENGIFNQRIGMRYRKEILEVGASRDEIKTTKAFLMRSPSKSAFLKSLGI